jgi:UDP:flavonoid glycosyltransferase YjiC (YdhE family)
MKILIASTPASGHLNPLLSIASRLVASGHEVAVQVNEELRPAVDMRTNQATPETIRQAVEEIFTQPRYRERAQQLSIEFSSHDVETELLSLIEGCVPETVGA